MERQEERSVTQLFKSSYLLFIVVYNFPYHSPHDCKIGPVAAVRNNSLCDPQIVVLGLGVMCISTCMFTNAPTTQEKHRNVRHRFIFKERKEILFHHQSVTLNFIPLYVRYM